jgi:tryptophan synthase alpha chain
VSLESHLRARRDAGRKLLVPYVTGMLDDRWLDLVRALADAGADAIEIGLPFSDPAMDGPTIQQASARALERGANPLAILDGLRRADVGVPLVAMTYFNVVFRAGLSRFADLLAGAGISAAIVPDLPLDESGEWEAAARFAGVETVLLAAPVSPDDRLDEICRRSSGFVYAVSTMGVTGARQQVADSAGVLAARIRARTDKPVLVGFGISTPENAVDAAAGADGVIVASALMSMTLDGAPVEDVAAAVASMRSALDEQHP